MSPRAALLARDAQSVSRSLLFELGS